MPEGTGRGTRGSRRRGRGGGGAGDSRQRRPLVAALDLGTNNCRLLVAQATRRGELRVVDSFSRIVRLGEGLAQSGRLSEEAMARTVEALKVCASVLASNKVRRVRAVATEACRRATNGLELVERAKAQSGIALEIISAQEEARLASVGCAPLIDPNAQGALVFDIGGGSTEIIWMRKGDSGRPLVIASTSQPLGVVTLAEGWGGGPLDREGYGRLAAELTQKLEPVKAAMEVEAGMTFDPAGYHLLGTSGTVTTLAAVALGLPRYDRGKVDASWHDRAQILETAEKLARMTVGERAAIGCIGPDRADLIVPGCAVFAAIARLWPCARLRVADRGLREGILRELMGRR
ncbi:MAG TPA: Ppx/GppA phosphatase family protein [Rhizomicrobium sp.]|nr:Ppx/GppA phosphatase family protein [Rhizomicrobium sp.]